MKCGSTFLAGCWQHWPFVSSLAGAAAASQYEHRLTHERGEWTKKFHYLTAGHGPVPSFVHGYTQTSRMWKPSSHSRCKIYGDRARDWDWSFEHPNQWVGYEECGYHHT